MSCIIYYCNRCRLSTSGLKYEKYGCHECPQCGGRMTIEYESDYDYNYFNMPKKLYWQTSDDND